MGISKSMSEFITECYRKAFPDLLYKKKPCMSNKSNMTEMDKNRLRYEAFQENSVIIDFYFHKWLDLLLKHVLSKMAAKDWIICNKVQARGNIHWTGKGDDQNRYTRKYGRSVLGIIKSIAQYWPLLPHYFVSPNAWD